MKASPRILTLSLLSATTLASTLLVPTAAAAAAPRPAAKAQATTKAARQQVETFWTKARMRSATPMERLLTPGTATARKLLEVDGAGLLAPTAYPSGGASWTGGGQVVKTTGRVFFTYQGRTASCSGSAVVSQNKSTVITAGHCVKLNGAWHTNWVFVPGYHNGNAPYGVWTARRTLTTPQWGSSENFSYDVGAAVLNPQDGKLLTDVVGGQSIAFNQPRWRRMYAFGYPAEAPYDGSKLTYCSGPTIVSLLWGTHGMNCNMTGGSSGGPWFVNFNEATGTGTLASVNSYRLNLPILWRNMYGPYFGNDAKALYEEAQKS